MQKILLKFVKTLFNIEETLVFEQILTYDLYLRENVKSRPSWASKQDPYTASYVEFFRKEENREKYFKGYEHYTTKQIQRMTHIERFDFNILAKDEEDVKRPVFVWFDYLNRDPLTYKSRNLEVEL